MHFEKKCQFEALKPFFFLLQTFCNFSTNVEQNPIENGGYFSYGVLTLKFYGFWKKLGARWQKSAIWTLVTNKSFRKNKRKKV